jgi:peptide/nickel transport system permease protein
MIGWRLENTLFLAATAAMIAVPLSVILGMLAALYRNSWFDKTISLSTLSTISFPEFFVAYILIAVLSVRFNLCPSMCTITDEMTFFEKVYNILLPCLTLTLVVTAHMMRMTRAAIINVLSSEYIEMARLKGIRWGRIIVHHAFPNVLSPIINVIVLNLAWLIVGVVVVEVVFVYPGLGQLMVDSVSKRDLPVIQACGLIFAITYISLNLLADVLSMISNPKLRQPR